MAASSFFTSFSLLLALFCGRSAAQNQSIPVPAITHDKGCIHLPIIHSTNVNYFAKRGVQLQLANRSDVAYYAQLSIGTPPQQVFVQLDTGSFELWVNPDCNTVTGADAVFCDRIGRYETSSSSTASPLRTTKTLRYGIGVANITYVKDTITLAGSTTALQDVQFGVATSSEDAFSGILGIGYGDGIATKYPNFVDQLQNQNATKVKAYTLALGSKDAEEGVIVFGGVDTSKFSGSLTRIPVIPAAQAPDKVPRFWVDMKAITFNAADGGPSRTYEGSGIPAFLDSGSTMTLLPPNLTAEIGRDFGSPAPDDNGFFRVDCALTEMEGTLDFEFEGVVIKVPYKELIREVPGSPKACFLGITPSESFVLLGDTFLRSAYAVFDLENNNIWMTQAANCGDTPAALNSADDLATLTGACGVTNSGITGGSSASAPGGGGGGSGGSGTGTDSASTTSGSASGPVSTGSPQNAASFGVRGVDDGLLGRIWSLGMVVVVSAVIGRVI